MKIALIGYGKMGKEIDAIATSMGHQIVLRYNGKNGVALSPTLLADAEVAIEFSVPAAAFYNIGVCVAAGIPVVCGTTGWLKDLDKAKTMVEQKKGALLYASNFSIGVNVFFALNRYLAKIMDKQAGYEVSLREIHHTQKLDAPSGTAISLAEDILCEINRKDTWVNERAKADNELEIISERVPGVPGTHIVDYKHAIDHIQISHTAHSREGFVRGAILAAEWIKDKQGYFEMSDVLNL